MERWKTLADRLRWVLQEKLDGGMRAWGRSAGLTESTVGGIIRRSEEGWRRTGDEAGFELRTIQALAAAAHVNTYWLATGRRQPDDPEDPSSDETALSLSQIDAACALAVGSGVPREYVLAYRRRRPKDLSGVPLLMHLIGSYSMAHSGPTGPSNDDGNTTVEVTVSDTPVHPSSTENSGGASAITQGRGLLDQARSRMLPAPKGRARKT